MSSTSQAQAAVLSSMHRAHEIQQAYIAHLENKRRLDDISCDMCRLIREKPLEFVCTIPITGEKISDQTVQGVCLITNEFPYAIYDGRYPTAHHMLVPREHYSTSSALPKAVRAELDKVRDALLDSGTYDGSFVRSTFSPTASVPGHLHIHMMKLGPKVTKQVYDATSGVNTLEYENQT